jgi:hypothetical protein
MCTWLSQQVEASGSARGVTDWMRVTAVNVMYDHPVSTPYDHALLLDFINPSQGVGARVAVELSATSARELVRAIEVALASPEATADLSQQLLARQAETVEAPTLVRVTHNSQTSMTQRSRP